MQIESLAYDRLPFTKLFKDYTGDFNSLAPFYKYDPFNEDHFTESLERVGSTYPLSRPKLVEWLTDFNNDFDPPESTLRNISRLEDERAAVFVTGQQVTLLGGPLYTIYKTLTTIQLSRYWERQLDVPVVPVFWLADEDHDYEEVKQVTVPKSGKLLHASYDNPRETNPAASEVVLDADFSQTLDYLRQEMRDTDFSDRMWSMVEESYTEGTTLGRAFGRLLLSLFSEQGLVLAGSHDATAKNLSKEVLADSVTQIEQIREALDQQTRKLAADYHQQVKVYDSNLFLHSEKGRVKIHHEDGSWYTDHGQRWSGEELVDSINQKPERFSPNVFLRPILQDHLLPTIGYVGGPGEIAYYGQMKQMYTIFDRQMPIIFPRLSATVIESKIDRIFDELPFQIPDYQQRIEDLESQYAREVEEVDVDGIFDEWKKQVQQLSDTKSEQIKEIDPTLEKAVGKATAVYFNELDKLRGKVHRSTKQQEETQLKRLRKIKNQLFPEHTLQERVICSLFYMNKYGLDLWDQLLNQLSYDSSYRKHQIIYI